MCEAEAWPLAWLNLPLKLSEAVHAGSQLGSFAEYKQQILTRRPLQVGLREVSSCCPIEGELETNILHCSALNSRILAMQLWTSVASHLRSKSKPSNKMNTSEYQANETRVRIERSSTIALSPSKKQASAQPPRPRIDPAQTLQLPFHESQKAETPFVNPLGAQSPIRLTPPHSPISKLPPSQRTSQSFVDAAARPRRSRDEKVTWQGGCVKIVAIDAEAEKGEKKRSKKERSDEEVEPAKKKSKDQNRMTWTPRQRKEGVVSHWGPNVGLRRGYT